MDADTGAAWDTLAPTLPLRPWSDIREAWVNPFPLAKAPHVVLIVGARRHADADDEAPTSCRRGRGKGLSRPGLSDAD